MRTLDPAARRSMCFWARRIAPPGSTKRRGSISAPPSRPKKRPRPSRASRGASSTRGTRTATAATTSAATGCGNSSSTASPTRRSTSSSTAHAASSRRRSRWQTCGRSSRGFRQQTAALARPTAAEPAQRMYDAGDRAGAARYLEQAAERAPEPEHALHLCLRLGDWAAEARDWSKAAKWYGRAWAVDRSAPGPLYLRAWALGEAGWRL